MEQVRDREPDRRLRRPPGARRTPVARPLGWREDDFLRETEGSAIRRIGFERWQRNLAVALGNALAASGDPAIVAALKARREEASALVREHIDWALQQAAPAALAALPA